MLLRPARPIRRRRAAALVEFAVVAPVFFLVILAIVEVARLFMVGSLMTNAARSGCRAGVLPGKSNSDVSAAVTNALNNQGISGTTTTIQVNGTSQDVSTAQTGDIVTVTVTVPVGNVSWVPGTGSIPGTITGTYTLPHE